MGTRWAVGGAAVGAIIGNNSGGIGKGEAAAAGAVIGALMSERDSPGDFHLILEGEIELSINDRRMTTVGEGDLLGADATVGIQNHSMTATANTACVLLVIPPRAIHRLAKQRPKVFGMLMNNIARDFARRLSGMSLFAGGRPQAGRRTTSVDRGPSLPPTGDAGFHYPVTKPWPRMGRDLW